MKPSRSNKNGPINSVKDSRNAVSLPRDGLDVPPAARQL